MNLKAMAMVLNVQALQSRAKPQRQCIPEVTAPVAVEHMISQDDFQSVGRNWTLWSLLCMPAKGVLF